MSEKDELLDLLGEWYDLWFRSEDMVSKLPNALHVRTAIKLTEAGRAFAMSEWVPGQGKQMDCPTCGSTRRQVRHKLWADGNAWPAPSVPCPDPWHGPALPEDGPGTAEDPPCNMIQ